MAIRDVRGWGHPARVVLGALAAVLILWTPAAGAQLRASYSFGQGISPAFEGWMSNDDGSYDIVFGYMNRNWEEEIQVPVGPDNYFAVVDVGALNELERSGFELAAADQGQPTYFLPRRNRFVFTVRVPADFSEGDREVVWTLAANGSTERAYGSLARDYMIDNMVIMSETGSLGAGTSNERVRANEPPTLELDSETVRTVSVGEVLTLVAVVTDDGVPEAGGNPPEADATAQQLLDRALREPRRITVGKTDGLHLSWFVYRGPGAAVGFDPPQVKPWEDTRTFANSPWAAFWVPPPVPEDGRYVTRVTFPEPGTYVLRGRADDGGLFADVEVTVQVTPGTI